MRARDYFIFLDVFFFLAAICMFSTTVSDISIVIITFFWFFLFESFFEFELFVFVVA